MLDSIKSHGVLFSFIMTLNGQILMVDPLYIVTQGTSQPLNFIVRYSSLLWHLPSNSRSYGKNNYVIYPRSMIF